MFNFMLMQLFRFEKVGRVCAGDFLGEERWNAPEPYMPYKGNFILIIILIIYGMAGLFCLSIFCLAVTLKF